MHPTYRGVGRKAPRVGTAHWGELENSIETELKNITRVSNQSWRIDIGLIKFAVFVAMRSTGQACFRLTPEINARL
jgi:hypothetical protein